jgi:hypothetical protein
METLVRDLAALEGAGQFHVSHVRLPLPEQH